MKENNPVISKSPKKLRFSLNQFFKPGCKRAFQGLAGLIIVGLILYGVIAFGSRNSKIYYSPPDVVYGEKVIAVHLMGEVTALTPVGKIVSDPSGEPNIQISEYFYDFGSVSSTQVLTRTFIIANTGLSPLIIQQSFTTCGCTTAEFTAKEIPPGKVALMTLRFDPAFHSMAGTTVRRGVIIYTNDPNHPTQEIWIQVSIR
jgi:hypothetical protein